MNTLKKQVPTRILISLLIAAAITFASCSQDSDLPETQPQSEQITFAPGFASDAPETRVATASDFTSSWENGDAIGLYAVRHASGTPANLAATGNYIDNQMLTRGASSWTTPTLYYPASTDQLDFYAYYPKQTVSSSSDGYCIFTVQTDQSAGTNYNQSDLLLAKTMNVAKSASPVALVFSHAMALVQVEVPGATEGTTVTLQNVRSLATFNLQTQTVTAGPGRATIRMARVSGTNLFRALVPPQTIASGNALFLKNSGESSMYVLSATLTLTQGGVAKYTVALP